MDFSVFSDLFFRFLFPQRCAFCGKVINQNEYICKECVHDAVKTNANACSFCGLPKDMCDCNKHIKFFDCISAPYLYEDNVKRGVLHYKNAGNRRAVDFFVKEMAECYRDRFDFNADYIAYVPQTDNEVKIRGFNQNKEIADKLSAELKIPVFDGMVKLYDVKPQKTVSGKYKQGNVAGIFDLTDSEKIIGKNIILTDDVKTSGSTLNECAKMLKLYGADKVYALSLAVVAPKSKKKDNNIKQVRKDKKQFE